MVRNFGSNILSLFFSLSLMLGLAGSLNAAPRSNTPAPRDAAQYESWLANQVRHQLVMIPWYSVFDNLEYKVDGTKVTLSGQVVRPVLKDEGGAAVKKIEGVTAVDNQIEVLPLSPNDDHIRRQELRAIYSFASLQRYGIQAVPSIHIVVKNGNVTLEGVVANEADKNVAFVRADGVPGVFSVTNKLRVEKKS
jgi:hyperosmotically inducible protein